MAGVGAVIIATYGSTERDNNAEIVDYHGTPNVIEQAAGADVELVVFISTIYASRPDHYQDVEPSLGWKARAEEVIRGSGIPYCIIRSGWLTDGGGGEPLAVSQLYRRRPDLTCRPRRGQHAAALCRRRTQKDARGRRGAGRTSVEPPIRCDRVDTQQRIANALRRRTHRRQHPRRS